MGRKWPNLMREKRAARRTGNRAAVSEGLAEVGPPPADEWDIEPDWEPMHSWDTPSPPPGQ